MATTKRAHSDRLSRLDFLSSAIFHTTKCSPLLLHIFQTAGQSARENNALGGSRRHGSVMIGEESTEEQRKSSALTRRAGEK